jgi:hypothetical protein
MLGAVDWHIVALAGTIWAVLVLASWTLRWSTRRSGM